MACEDFIIDGMSYAPVYLDNRMTQGVITDYILGPYTNTASIDNLASPWTLVELLSGNGVADGEISFGVSEGSVVTLNINTYSSDPEIPYQVVVEIYSNFEYPTMVYLNHFFPSATKSLELSECCNVVAIYATVAEYSEDASGAVSVEVSVSSITQNLACSESPTTTEAPTTTTEPPITTTGSPTTPPPSTSSTPPPSTSSTPPPSTSSTPPPSTSSTPPPSTSSTTEPPVTTEPPITTTGSPSTSCCPCSCILPEPPTTPSFPPAIPILTTRTIPPIFIVTSTPSPINPLTDFIITTPPPPTTITTTTTTSTTTTVTTMIIKCESPCNNLGF